MTSQVELILDSPYARIGRDAGAEIRLDHPDVSRLHALLLTLAGRPFLLDLGSRSGLVWPNGRAREGWLDEGSSVRIGPYTLTARPEPEVSANNGCGWPEPTIWPDGCDHPLSSRPVVHDQLPPLTVEFPDDRSGDSIDWEMRSLVTLIGSSPACKICIEHPGISRFEAVLIRTPIGPWAVDLLGRSGLRQNGQRQPLVSLSQGDSLTVGDRRFVSRLSKGESGRRAGSSHRQLARRDQRTDAGPALRPSVVDPLPAELVEQFGQMQSEMLDQVRQSLLTMGRWLGNVHREEMVRMREEMAELRAAVASRDEAGRPTPVLGDNHGKAAPLNPPTVRPTRNGTKPKAAEATPKPSPPTPAIDDIAGDDLHTLLIDRIEQLQREQRSRWGGLLQRSKESNA